MINVDRRPEAPASLAEKSHYNGEDVREALEGDFHRKCYLCEGMLNAGFDVEHLRPKARFPEQMFDWDNLFPAHTRCNGRRKKWNENMWPEGDLLDCTKDDVEGRLSQQIVADISVGAVFFAKNGDDSAAKNTALELNHLHAGDNIAGREILSAVHIRYTKLLQVLASYYHAAEQDGTESESAAAHSRKLSIMLRRDTPYAGLMRDTFQKILPDRLKQQTGLV